MFDNERKLLKECRSPDMHLVNMILTINKLQSLVVRVQYKLPLYKIVIPLLQGSNYGVELLIIGTSLLSGIAKLLIKKDYGMLFL